MHPNSLEANKTVDRQARYKIILETYKIYDRPMTDREIMEILGFIDMNCTRPRITELIDKGILTECGKVKDERTGRSVRVVRIKRPEEENQHELF